MKEVVILSEQRNRELEEASGLKDQIIDNYSEKFEESKKIYED